MENKNSTGLIVLSVALIILSICLGGYIFYDKVLNKPVDTNRIEDKQENSRQDDNLSLIKNELNDFISALNTSNVSLEDKCFYLSTDYLDVSNNDLLEQMAPYLMSCMYNIKYDEIDINPLYSTRVMTEADYTKFTNYFNVSLEKISYENNVYYKAYDTGDGFGSNQYTYSLDSEVKKENNKYKAIVTIKDKNNRAKEQKANLVLSVKDNHIYYEQFTI